MAERLLIGSATGRQPAWVQAVRRFSEAGSYGIGWVVLFAVVVTWREGVVPALVAAGLVLGTLAANTVVKQLVRRPRPVSNSAGHRPRTYSMPSAHTSMAVVGAATMSTVLPGLVALWIAVAVALAASRVLLGMHYVSDVLAGAAFGTALALLVAVPVMHAVL
jgi:undecaprenyl-diphosphatase